MKGKKQFEKKISQTTNGVNYFQLQKVLKTLIIKLKTLIKSFIGTTKKNINYESN